MTALLQKIWRHGGTVANSSNAFLQKFSLKCRHKIIKINLEWVQYKAISSSAHAAVFGNMYDPQIISFSQIHRQDLWSFLCWRLQRERESGHYWVSCPTVEAVWTISRLWSQLDLIEAENAQQSRCVLPGDVLTLARREWGSACHLANADRTTGSLQWIVSCRTDRGCTEIETDIILFLLSCVSTSWQVKIIKYQVKLLLLCTYIFKFCIPYYLSTLISKPFPCCHYYSLYLSSLAHDP